MGRINTRACPMNPIPLRTVDVREGRGKGKLFKSGRKGPVNDDDYLPTLEECLSSPLKVRQVLGDRRVGGKNVPPRLSLLKDQKIRLPSSYDDIFEVPGADQLIDTNFGAQPAVARRASPALEGKEGSLPFTLPFDTTEGGPQVPIGTPVLALWRAAYYPATVIEVHASKPDQYRIRYCDDVMRWMKRSKFVTTWDEDFHRVPIADVEIIRNSFSSSQEAKKAKLPPEMIPTGRQQLAVLKDLLLGKRSTRRSVAFFKSQKERSVLHHEIRPGPLTFDAYFALLSSLQEQVLKLLGKKPEYFKAFHRESGVAETCDSLQLRLILRQFTAIVALPQLILDMIGRMDPSCTDLEAMMVEMSHANQKDYVDYLLGQRDLARWGRRKIK